MELEQSVQQQVLPEARKRYPNPSIGILTANLVVFAIAVWGWASFGSITGAVSYYLNGHTVFPDAREKFFHIAEPGDTVGVTFKIANRGSEPVRILGCQASCTCIIPDDIPFTLVPGEARDLEFSIRNDAKTSKPGLPTSSTVRYKITLFTSNPA